MAQKFLTVDANGNYPEVEAITTSAGAGDAGKIPATGADGRLSETLMPDGIGPETGSAVASEALDANDVVNLFDDAGTLKMRKASAADATKPVRAYVKTGVTMGASGTYYTDGKLPGTGLTKGSTYWLSAATPGAVTATPPSGTGNIQQPIGFAESATAIVFEPSRNFVIK